jgi:hypothetical protein
MSFFNLPQKAYLEQTEGITTLKHVSYRKYSFQKLTQSSQGNNLLHAHTSNTDGFQ